MGWPKGKPRKGYIKKDGTIPAKRGSLLAPTKPQDIAIVAKSPKTPLSPPPALSIVPRGSQGKTAASGRAIIEPCPKCGYAYADGGYCEDCGWTRWNSHCPHCRKAAKTA